MVLMLLPPAQLLCFFVTAVESLGFTIAVEQSQINVTIGANVAFMVQPSDNFSSGSWSFNGNTVCQWIGELVSVDNAYKSRAELLLSNGTLVLKSVKKSDSGEYRVNMVPASGAQTSATITLQVTEPPSGLAGGVIAGNVIWVTAGVVLACALMF